MYDYFVCYVCIKVCYVCNVKKSLENKGDSDI